MKNTALSIALILSIASLHATTYDQARKKYKYDLFLSQEGVLSEKEYSAFLEPYLQEAEEKLELAHYCREHPDSPFIQEYFDCLLRFNFACFKKYIDTTGSYKKRIKLSRERLLDVMKKMKKEWNLTDFDPVADCDILAEIIKRANKEFYKNLGIKYKALCFFAKVGSIFK